MDSLSPSSEATVNNRLYLETVTAFKIGLPLLVVGVIATVLGLLNATLLSAPVTESTTNRLVVFQNGVTGWDWVFIFGLLAASFSVALIFYRRWEHALFSSTFVFILVGMFAFVTPVLAVGEAKEWVAAQTNMNRFDISDSNIFLNNGETATIQNDEGVVFTLMVEEGTVNNQTVTIYRLTQSSDR